MSNDHIKIDVHSVRGLRTAVSRYTEEIQRTSAQSRKRVAAADQIARHAVEQRRAERQKREADLKQARETLARCQGNCGGLQRDVALASERLKVATAALTRARKAEQMTAETQRDLAQALRAIESKVSDHASAAASALADLEARLAALPRSGVTDTLRGIAVGVATFSTVATAIPDAAHIVGNAIAASGHPNAFANSSLAEFRQESSAQEQGHWADAELERRRRDSGASTNE